MTPEEAVKFLHDIEMESDLFKRGPTDEEKRHYRTVWGGVDPVHAAMGMVGMFGLGTAFGITIMMAG